MNEERFMEVDGNSIHVSIHGEGENLVLLHGNMEDSSYFHNQIKEFANQYKVYAIDTRGHGKSSTDNKEFSVSILAQELNIILEKLNISKGYFLGFSDGGNILLKFACNNPDRIKAMIIVGANIETKGLDIKTRFVYTTFYLIKKLAGIFREKSRIHARILRLVTKEPDISLEEIKEITIPTLIMVGEKDCILPHHTEKIHTSIKNSKLVIIKEQGHNLLQDDWKNANRIIMDFINKKRD